MSATINSSTHLDSITRFIDHLDSAEDYYFLFAGRVAPWADETGPDTAIASYDNFKDVRDTLIFMKRIRSEDCVPGLKRYNWESGKVYSPWRSDKDMLTEQNFVHPDNPYYVFVDDFSTGALSRSIFLCLDNNNGATSINQPSGTQSTPITTADGYIWQFMYNIRNDQYQYVTDAVIPCPIDDSQKSSTQITVEGNTTPGTINIIRINNAGTGYSDGTINITGDGTGATATFTVDPEDGSINKITMSNFGSGYSYADLEIVSSSSGNDAELKAMISPSRGHGYNSAEQLNAGFVIIRASFINTEGGKFPTQNAYRRIGILKNVKSTTDQLLIDDSYNFFDELQVSLISDPFPLTQTIRGVDSGATAKIFYRDPAEGTTASFFLIDRKGSFTIGEEIQYEEDGTVFATAEIDDINLSTQNKYSGDIFYFENVQFVSRRTGQTERFIIPIEF
jgi:hypothetical protein